MIPARVPVKQRNRRLFLTVLCIQVIQYAGRFEQALPRIRIFKIRHLNPAVRLEEGVALTAGCWRVGPGLDALLCGADFSPALLAQIMQGVRDLQLTQFLSNQAREGATLKTP